MKKILALLILILTAGPCLSQTAPKSIPAAFCGNWIDTTTNLWALSLWDGFAAAEASLWDYEKWSGNRKAATVMLRNADGIRRKLSLKLLNDSTLVMTGTAGRHILLRESVTTAGRPFTAAGRDTTSFRFGPWVNDSIQVEGFITGYKPGDAVYHYWTPDLFGFEAPNTPMPTDSLGRFRATIPATHNQLRSIGTTVVAGPGDRIFIGYSSEGERHLFMGDNARVNQELGAHWPGRVVRKFLPAPNLNERIGDPMSWRFSKISGRDMALMEIDKYCREHQLSHKTQKLYRGLAKVDLTLTISGMPLQQTKPLAFPYAYFKSGEGMDHTDPELFLGPENGILHYMLLWMWRTYESPYIIQKAGLSGKDVETFSMGGRFRTTDPDRFNDFLARNQSKIDSVFRTITPQTRLQWVAPVVDTLIPGEGLNRDIVFAYSLAMLWSTIEEPLTGETLTLINNRLSGSPFLRDTLRGLNERYRMLVERNAALEIPMGTVDSTLSQPDSILAAILRPYAGKVVYMVFMEPGDPGQEEELKHLPAIRDSLADRNVELVFVSAALSPQKWRNTIAKYDLVRERQTHFRLQNWQMGILVQKYANSGMPAFFLFDRAGAMTASPTPKPSEGDKLLETIDELLR